MIRLTEVVPEIPYPLPKALTFTETELNLYFNSGKLIQFLLIQH